MTFQEAHRFITARVKGQEICGLQLSNNGPLVLIREEVGHIKGDIPDAIALRTNIDVHAAPTFLVIMKGVFQLVEFTLLFLKTTWFHCVCSCSIRQLRILIQSKDPKEDYRYTLQRPPMDHVPYSNDIVHNSMTSCWCVHRDVGDDSLRSRFQDHPLFYLLIEVGLGSLILHVQCIDERRWPMSIQLTYVDPASADRVRRYLKDLEVTLCKFCSVMLSRVHLLLRQNVITLNKPPSRCPTDDNVLSEKQVDPREHNRAELTEYYWKVMCP